MKGYVQVSLKDMIQELGESKVKSILSNFSCPLNEDVEYFLKYKAIEFAKQNIAPTHLVFASYKDKLELVGYFSLTIKTMSVAINSLSSKYRSRIRKFGNINPDLKAYLIPAPLIAQLGKNYTNGLNGLITGDELLKLACDKISIVQQDVGGKVVYLECEEKQKLIDFYSENGFVSFGKRSLDKDEVDKMDGKYLIQMLKYMD
ncbi:hypothetical protein [Cellulosilyticum lentocellum]|uniref:N-acetyltransferase domain-containing protein n=1 Tax=Cellulosilyticum lentocellum (strain ATCC 49066 / DSM 5427 / NCIMB 11756 / RHM5) TaxID=642492 RepID=F2JNY8_CELLD|nr:hypothetical protein [Cellulosilyticum lentocellum]ADZ83602.1 hypothetical protein Clole_1882 [Cellulosilyticum lentocellum DSM 5427]